MDRHDVINMYSENLKKDSSIYEYLKNNGCFREDADEDGITKYYYVDVESFEEFISDKLFDAGVSEETIIEYINAIAENLIEYYKDDLVDAERDACEYHKDPYAYHGVSRSDFFNPRR